MSSFPSFYAVTYLALHNLLYIPLHTPVHRKEDIVLQNQKRTSCHKMMVKSCTCTCSVRRWICLHRTTLPRREYQRQLFFDPCDVNSIVRTTRQELNYLSIKISLLDWLVRIERSVLAYELGHKGEDYPSLRGTKRTGMLLLS